VADHVHVGTGTTSESASDTALVTFVAGTANVISSSSTAQASAPYYASWTRTFRFNPGFAGSPGNVNISEVGISSQITTGDLFSRARVKDGASPLADTTITVLGDEWLDVAYELRLYPDHILPGGSPDDGSGTITISGAGSPEVFSYAVRPSNVNSTTYYSAGNIRGRLATFAGVYATAFEATSVLGAVTSAPSGSSDNIPGTASYATYSAGTFSRDVTLTIGLTDANLTGGVGALLFGTGLGAYQMSFSPAVPKDATKVWTWVCNLAWTRASL